jgi:hypothetical protein
MAGRTADSVYAVDLRVVRRQRVQILRRRGMPSTTSVLFWTLALKVRLVFGALRSHRPECLCLMLRPGCCLAADVTPSHC